MASIALNIYTSAGALRYEAQAYEGSTRKYSLMGDDYVQLNFSVVEPVAFALGDYVDVPLDFEDEQQGYERFELAEMYAPKYNTTTGGYDYELKMEAEHMKWRNKIMKYMPNKTGQEASWSLTDTLTRHMEVFLSNLSALGYKHRKTTDYGYEIIEEQVAEGSKLITYSNTSLLDALNAMAETFDCEWWLTDNIIHFGKCEMTGDAVDFEIGVNLFNMEASASKNTFATKIYVFGAERNIPSNYREMSPDVVANGIVQRRLMLPEDTPYIEAKTGLSQEEVVEAVVIFDDVYPRRTGTINAIQTKEYTDTTENADGTTTDETWLAYRFKDTGITFKEEYILDGEELRIVFQTGALCGMDFAVAFNPDAVADETSDDAQWFEIVRNDDYGRNLPAGALIPAVGDTYVLYGWDSTKIEELGLVAAAEQELLEEGQKYMEKSKIDPNTYTCTLFSRYAYGLDALGNENSDYKKRFEKGQKVNLINRAYFLQGSRQSRIIGYEYDLAVPYNSPQYTVGEAVAYSRLDDLEDTLDSITLNGNSYTSTGGSGSGKSIYIIGTNDRTAASDANVYSARRSNQMYLRKDREDSAAGQITFLQGLVAEVIARFKGNVYYGENFVAGMTGEGGRIDSAANAELESLILRRWLEVPELRYNRTEILLGDNWNAPGGGIVESVEITSDTQGVITLHLEDGEIGAVAVDDICMGYFHNFENPALNAVLDSDDSIGNRTYAGFCTIYFRVTEILSTDGTNARFSYSLRPTSDTWQYSFHPQSQMHFVAYGNFSDTTRQTSRYETRSYTRYLYGVNYWEYNLSNLGMQTGDLSNLYVYGLNMSGYSAYLKNVYFTGTIQQVVDKGRRMRITQSLDGVLAPSETETVMVYIEDVLQTDYTSEYTFKVERDSGDTAADAVWNALPEHLNCTSVFEISFTDLHIGEGHTGISTLFYVIATPTAGGDTLTTTMEY